MPNYAELSPSELANLWRSGAVAILPWGALEWHGDHLPLGLDGFLAENFCQLLAERIGGVCLPTVWLPITTLPHPASQSIQTETLRALLDDMIAGLAKSGAAKIAIITGHCAQGHLVELYEAALRGMDDHEGVLIFSGAQLQVLNRPETMDHAARYETSQLLAIRPDLIDLTVLRDEIVAQQDCVLGEDPRLGSAEEGRELTEAALEGWSVWLETATDRSLQEHYRLAFDEVQPYVDAYFRGSWDEALAKWWQER